jgi:tetratricopeptide (TPR) repeat protein
LLLILGLGVTACTDAGDTALCSSDTDAYALILSGRELRPDEALTACTRALASDLTPEEQAETYNTRGQIYAAKGMLDQAIEDFDAALRLDRNYAQAYFNRGVAYDLKGEHDQAIEDFDAALRLDPNDAMTYIARGFAYERKGQYDQARRDFEKALTLDPGLERARTDRAALEDELAEPLPSEPPQRAPTATMPDGKRVAHPRPDRGQPAARLQPGLRRVSARRLRAGVHAVRGHRGRAHRGRRQEWRAAPVPAQGRTRTDQAHPGAGQLRALSPMPLPAARCARAAGP